MSYDDLKTSLQELLRRDPGYISLSIRWLAWLVALFSVLLGAAPALNLINAPLALTVSGCQLLLLTVNPAWLRFEVGLSEKNRGSILRPVADLGVALVCVFMTGGWNSPLYLFAVTVVLAPSLRYGLGAAFISAVAFTAGFLLICQNSSTGFAPAYVNSKIGPGFVSTLANPFLIALFAAFLGEVLQKLRAEQERVKILAAANERSRLVRDIHDGVAQTLFMLALSLETGQALAEKEGASKTSKHLESLVPISRKALIELRNTMHDQEPLELGQERFQETVASLIRDYQSATSSKLQLRLADTFHQPDSHLLDLFRMLQEILSNACHHAKAENIVVSLGWPIDSSLTVTDDGKGFEPGTVKRGRGLDNLRRRARETGMRLEIGYALENNSGSEIKVFWDEPKRDEL